MVELRMEYEHMLSHIINSLAQLASWAQQWQSQRGYVVLWDKEVLTLQAQTLTYQEHAPDPFCLGIALLNREHTLSSLESLYLPASIRVDFELLT